MADTAIRSVRSGKLLITGLAVVGGLLILGRLLSDVYVEVLWYRSAGYTSVFYRRLAWLWGTRTLWALIVGVALFLNLRLVARTLAGIQIKRRFGNLEISEQLPRAYVLWGMILVSVLLAAWFAGSIPQDVTWTVMAALQGVEWGLADPVLGRDVASYVFTLPLLRMAVVYLMILDFLVFTLAAGGYAATGAMRWGKGGIVMGNQPRIHLGALVALFLALLSVRFWLGRPGLLTDGNSGVQGLVQGIFGYADAEARLAAYQTMALMTLAAAGALMWGVWKNRLVPVASGLGAVIVGSLVILQFYPSLVQRFRVTPNELEWETPFIEHNLAFTRAGFALSEMERRSFRYLPADSTDWTQVARQFEGLPMWTPEALLTTFRAREARFQYYEFERVDFTRYAGEGGDEVPVAVSVREIDPSGIPDESWQNVHLRDLYIRGMGAVAADAAGRTLDWGPPMHLYAIPPEFAAGTAPPELGLSRPWVYFGSRQEAADQQYVIVSAPAGGLPTEAAVGVPGVDFPEGILLDSPLKKLTLAWRFRDPNLLFTSQVTDSSRMVFRRSVRTRARQIAPFFDYLEDPYAVVADGRIVWILEGFTTTLDFPLSSRLEIAAGRAVSYVRNSVKVTVDAVTGETRFYALPVEDPLRDAYAEAFPGLLRPLSEMPETIRRHLRYSKMLLAIQGAVLLEYHQDTARRFHERQDVWDIPEENAQSTNPVPYRPEYGVWRLPDEEDPTFNLTTTFVPSGRRNLTAVLVGRLADAGEPELILFDVPVEDQAPGPHQVEALVEQSPPIAQQFSLWRSGGSQVWTGHLHVVPVGQRLFYTEPVFLAATDNAIPELARYVVSDGRRVSMQPTLDAAIAELAGGRVPTLAGGDTEDGTVSAMPETAGWPREALELLEQAEQRLRSGDWAGFGVAFDELRRILERYGRPVPGAPALPGQAPAGPP